MRLSGHDNRRETAFMGLWWRSAPCHRSNHRPNGKSCVSRCSDYRSAAFHAECVTQETSPLPPQNASVTTPRFGQGSGA